MVLSNKDLMTAVLCGQSFEVSYYMDETYGNWTERLFPLKNGNGYARHIIGASNWTYCPCCGNAASQDGCNCDCDENNENDYGHISNSDLVSELKKSRNSGCEIRLI